MSDQTATPEPVRLDDLAAPTFSPEVREMLDGAAAVADTVELSPDALMTQVSAELGLDDFGDPSFLEPLGVLLTALGTEAALSPTGRLTTAAQFSQLLKNRLLVTDLLNRHPEIHELEIKRPMIIAGLPRTGTTHLHNVISADPALRSLPYWESLEPVPTPGEATGPDGEDPRIVRAEGGVTFLDLAMPHFKRMHEMTTWHVHEEIQLLAIDFSTMLFDTMAPMPSWREYYLAHDQTPHYEYLKTVLKVVQYLRGGERWILKSPQHLEQFGPLVSTFPDATVLVTHRDPVSVTVSMATMISYAARLSLDPVDPVAIGAYWADRLDTMLTACVRDRAVLPAGQSMDVRFDDFMADDLGMVRHIYELADQPLPNESEAAIATYLDEHRRDRFGKVIYDPAPLGLDPADLRERFGPYIDRFGLS
jgi:hypothetical protein